LLEHGGKLRNAATRYQIPLDQWIDLSTGINPNGWPIPAIPGECWVRLPEADDGLVEAARRYYQSPHILPVAGSQAAIQALPLLRPASVAGMLSPAYAEHAANWQKAGHTLINLHPDPLNEVIGKLDVLVLINPNNPTGWRFSQAQLLAWHENLQARGGWLIVDEAFIDTTPECSLAAHLPRPGLIILRSLGKFFGLAGARCGFVLADEALLNQMNEQLGPWTLSHPCRYVAKQALCDRAWQERTSLALKQQSQRLRLLLESHGLIPDGHTDLFVWCKILQAQALHERLAQQGILTRLFETPSSVRFGLPKDEMQWERLDIALKTITPAIFGDKIG
jgi:cobalamin biosynthesis protein CobC